MEIRDRVPRESIEEKKEEENVRDFPGVARDIREWLEVINIATPSCFRPR